MGVSVSNYYLDTHKQSKHLNEKSRPVIIAYDAESGGEGEGLAANTSTKLKNDVVQWPNTQMKSMINVFRYEHSPYFVMMMMRNHKKERRNETKKINDFFDGQ